MFEVFVLTDDVMLNISVVLYAMFEVFVLTDDDKVFIYPFIASQFPFIAVVLDAMFVLTDDDMLFIPLL